MVIVGNGKGSFMLNAKDSMRKTHHRSLLPVRCFDCIWKSERSLFLDTGGH